MSLLDPPHIHSSAGVPRGAQPVADTYRTWHITYRDRSGAVQTGRVQIARDPFRPRAAERWAAMHAASFKFDVPLQRILSAVGC